jgi:hypothetical protein
MKKPRKCGVTSGQIPMDYGAMKWMQSLMEFWNRHKREIKTFAALIVWTVFLLLTREWLWEVMGA